MEYRLVPLAQQVLEIRQVKFGSLRVVNRLYSHHMNGSPVCCRVAIDLIVGVYVGLVHAYSIAQNADLDNFRIRNKEEKSLTFPKLSV